MVKHAICRPCPCACRSNRDVSCMLPLSITAQTVGQPSQRTWPVHRLRPAAFPDVPKNLITELERRGCTIPQPYTDRKSNVIRGEFARPGQTDWAVLCSAQGYTSLLVFLNAKETNSGALARIPDDPGRIFDWFIRPVGRKFIVGRYQAYGGPKPPPINGVGAPSNLSRGGVSAPVTNMSVSGAKE